MKIKDWLAAAEKQLSAVGISTARLDSLVLLEDCSGLDRSKILAEPELELSSEVLAKLKNLLSLRLSHLPLAYIRGKTEFYGREFIITPAVLEPRPESETMIDLLKALPDLPVDCMISDVGTGSGALGITAALELPKSQVELLDIDAQALKIAKMNVDLFTPSISVILSDLLGNSSQKSDVLLCNLPYVPDSHTVNEAATHEPKIAIFGGEDGLDLYRQLFKQVSELNKRPLYILCESLPPQHSSLAVLAAKSSYDLHMSEDFIQVFRAR